MAIFNDSESIQELYDLIDKFERSSLFELDITIPPPATKIKMMKLSQYDPEEPVKVTVEDFEGLENIKLRRDKFQSAPNDERKPRPVQDSDEKIITAPLVGTFYISPSPESEPYVKAGDKISKGMVLCIIEAMKTMNEIESETDGEIIAVLAKHGSPVEYGQPLFSVK